MTRTEKLSVFNAALTGLIGNDFYDLDAKGLVRRAAEFVRLADTSTVVDASIVATS
jgi:hypothetical protein